MKKSLYIIIGMFLLSIGCTNNEIDIKLLDAVKENNINKATQLIESGANANFIDYSHHLEASLLHIAVNRCNYELSNLLINNGADVDAVNYQLRTPLHYASTGCDSLKIIELLLENKANPNIKDENGFSPLDMAEEMKKDEIANLLRLNDKELKFRKKPNIYSHLYFWGLIIFVIFVFIDVVKRYSRTSLESLPFMSLFLNVMIILFSLSVAVLIIGHLYFLKGLYWTMFNVSLFEWFLAICVFSISIFVVLPESIDPNRGMRMPSGYSQSSKIVAQRLFGEEKKWKLFMMTNFINAYFIGGGIVFFTLLLGMIYWMM